MKFIPKRIKCMLQPFLISGLMTLVVSGVSTAMSASKVGGFCIGLWLGAWGLSWLVAFPTLVLILPFVRRVTFQLVGSCEQ